MPGHDRSDAEFQALHQALWRLIGETPDKIGRQIVAQPGFVPVEDGYSDGRPGDDFPVLRHLDGVLNIARGHGFQDIADAFAAVSDRLPWSQNPRYTREGGQGDLLDGYAYASLSGPEGPIRCMAPRGGFYLMGPGVHYPAHNHAPREIYLMMTPGVEWSLDEGAWFPVNAGEMIYHAPWQMHAMRSGAAPALAYVAWLEPGSRLDIGWGDKGGGRDGV